MCLDPPAVYPYLKKNNYHNDCVEPQKNLSPVAFQHRNPDTAFLLKGHLNCINTSKSGITALFCDICSVNGMTLTSAPSNHVGHKNLSSSATVAAINTNLLYKTCLH